MYTNIFYWYTDTSIVYMSLNKYIIRLICTSGKHGKTGKRGQPGANGIPGLDAVQCTLSS